MGAHKRVTGFLSDQMRSFLVIWTGTNVLALALIGVIGLIG